MSAFVAVTSLINIALGFWLSRYLDANSSTPLRNRSRTRSAGAKHAPAPHATGIDDRSLADARAVGEISPQHVPTAPQQPQSAASGFASQTPTFAAAPSVGASVSSQTSPSKAPLKRPATAAKETDKTKSDADADVEQEVLAGIEAFRARLAEMKEAASTGAVNKAKK